MILSDTTTRENGLIQRCEDFCGLGATGITGNSELFSKFVGWLNQWNGMGAHYAIQAWHGHDFDDKGYTTAPSGYFTGLSATRDYNFDDSYKMLKIKLVNVSYDGINYVPAKIIDDLDLNLNGIGKSNYDSQLTTSQPGVDLTAQGFKLYPNFTSAQVSAGGKIYVEWLRMPRAFATTGTDSYQPCLDFQFHHFPAVGANYEYCRLYLRERLPDLKLELWGDAKQKGLIDQIQEWYGTKEPSKRSMTAMKQNNK